MRTRTSLTQYELSRHYAVLHLGEDHATGYGLEDAGYYNVDFAVHVFAAVLDHYHGAVVEIADSLAEFFAFLDHVYLHLFAGQHHRLDGVGKLVDVEHLHALPLGYAVQVEVVGDHG